MSKLQKREKVLLAILAVLVVLFVLIMLIILPATDARTLAQANYEEQIKLKEERLVKLETLEDENVVVDENSEIPENFYDVEPFVGEFFSNINQDDILILLERFMPVEAYTDEAFFLGDINFDVQTVPIAADNGYDISRLQNEEYNNSINNIVYLEFIGKFDVIEEFIENIKSYEYPIYINALQISPFDPTNPEPIIDFNTEDPYSEVFVEYLDNGFRYRTENEEFVRGTMTLNFFELPVLTVYDDTNVSDQLFASLDETSAGNTNPFMPFQGFFTPTVIEQVDIDVAGEFDEEREMYTFKDLYNFEEDYFFFVGKPDKEVSGNTFVSNESSQGNFSLGLEYNFAKSFTENTAYAVAEGEKLTISESAQGLTMDVYSESTVPHTFGIVLRDSMGVETEVPILVGISETGWQEANVFFPLNLNFPCYIQRFYITDGAEKSVTSGNILIDNIKIAQLNEEE
ncbi:MAG: hypothetical protein ACK5LY_07030 [Lachnospirales bacterium]